MGTPSEAKSWGWSDVSKPSAIVYYKSKPKSDIQALRDCVVMMIRSQDQVPDLPLLNMQDGRIKNGVIPTLWAVEYWSLWFPFCNSSSVLKRFSPESFIAA